MAFLREATELHRSGKLSRARTLYERYLKAAPKDFDARYMLAMLECQDGRCGVALGPLRRLLGERPDRHDVRYTLGRALNELGRHEEAVAAFAPVLEATPENVEAFLESARALVALEDAEAARRVCARGLSVHPTSGALHYALGVALGALDRAEAAVRHLGWAARLDARNPEILYALGKALRRLNRIEEADRALDAALALAPGMLRARLLKLRLVPVIYDDEAEIGRWRARFTANLEALATEVPPSAGAFDAVAETTNFYLNYQGLDDREPATRWGDYVHAVTTARFPDMAPPPRSKRKPGGRVRVGFRSSFLVDHTVLHLFRAWMTGLDRDRFEVFVYAPAVGDAETERLARDVEHLRRFGPDFEKNARTVRSDGLDVLVHLDIGMEPLGACYGALRLAPVQAVTWGHPVTTGLPTMDLFLSSDAMEPAGGAAHYRERLVRLPGLGLSFEPPVLPDRPADRAALGVGADDTLFFCAQSLFKLLPQHDHVWAEIAARVPGARFLFLRTSGGEVVDGFMRRLERAFGAVGLRAADHVVWSPPVDRAGYLALNMACDVFLDSIGWSGGRTTLEAVASGLLPVSMPGPFMRGRHTAGILNQLGLPETIAADKAAYADIAVRAATDRPWREELRARLAANRAAVFADRGWLPALEAVLASAAR
ncbi:MAG TPA: tetratricopeptide repeat protein [Azospirillum sp.]|nr:tetratricopeptide repeat protein [Azospirillum sp.]